MAPAGLTVPLQPPDLKPAGSPWGLPGWAEVRSRCCVLPEDKEKALLPPPAGPGLGDWAGSGKVRPASPVDGRREPFRDAAGGGGVVPSDPPAAPEMGRAWCTPMRRMEGSAGKGWAHPPTLRAFLSF